MEVFRGMEEEEKPYWIGKVCGAWLKQFRKRERGKPGNQWKVFINRKV